MFSFFKKRDVAMSMTQLMDEIDTLIKLLQLNNNLSDQEYPDVHAIEYRCRVLDNGHVCHISLENIDSDGNKTHWRYLAIRLDMFILSMAGDWVIGRETLFPTHPSSQVDKMVLEQMKIVRDTFVSVDLLPKRWASKKMVKKELILVKENECV